jgi:hypothetical protein
MTIKIFAQIYKNIWSSYPNFYINSGSYHPNIYINIGSYHDQLVLQISKQIALTKIWHQANLLPAPALSKHGRPGSNPFKTHHCEFQHFKKCYKLKMTILITFIGVLI